MPSPQKPGKAKQLAIKAVVRYIPAELHECKSRWYISFYVWCPHTDQLERQVIKWNRITNLKERRRAAIVTIHELNQKLAQGWNPYIEQEAPKAFTPLKVAADQFLAQIRRQTEDGDMRPDTERTYLSFVRNLLAYAPIAKAAVFYTFNLTTDLLQEYLTELYLVRGVSARTRNNYKGFLQTFGAWLLEHRFTKINPTEGISSLRSKPKKRTAIPLDQISRMLRTESIDARYRLLCSMVLYCLMRRTELTKLRIRDLDLEKQVLILPSHSSKNRQEQPVAIPTLLIEKLKAHIEGYPGHFLVFGSNLKPSRAAITPKKVSDLWNKVRKQMGWPSEYQFYSLKDTGITAMLEKGIPVLQVRDQARHSDISITNLYAKAQGKQAPEGLRNFEI